MNPAYDFDGLVALVTGAASGMGLATASAFAESGARVVLADLDPDAVAAATEKITTGGHQALGVTCDVTDEAQVEAMIEQTVATFGRLDIAFNNAGIQGPTDGAADETAEGYDQVTAVNLRGIWACQKHELRQMRAQGDGGSIINCSSLGGLVGQANRSAYHASKHGAIGLTKSAAVEFASQGIRVNAVCPGVIDTPMASAMKQSGPDDMAAVLADQPIGRLGRAEEVAAAVLWLASPAASFIVGVALPVDGGFVAH